MKKVTLKSLSEKELALFQTEQIGNDCTLHAISAAVQILIGYRIPASELVKEVNRLWWRGRIYRIYPGGPVTPRMQVRIIRHLAQSRQLPISAYHFHLSPEILRNLPQDDDLAALLTLYWLPGQAPPIYHGVNSQNNNAVKGVGAHTMLFAAFDPEHHSEGIGSTPWGFINSWTSASTDLFWMADASFRTSWWRPLPGFGRNDAVLITKSPQQVNRA